MKPSLVSLVALLLISAVAGANEEFPVPEGFDQQILEPTGGKIARPIGWHYAELHGGPRYKWIISKEDPKKGPFRTGIMLQTFMGIKEGAGKTPEQFCKEFLESRATGAEKVHRRFPDTKMGLFTRAGVEVEEMVTHGQNEERHRVVYSVFWMGDGDLAAVMSAGCPADDWDTNKDRFDIMGQIELIDMSRFVKDGEVMDAPLKPEPPTEEAVLVAISANATNPAADAAAQHAKTIILYAERSPKVSVGLNVEYLPWLMTGEEVDNSEIMIAAYVGGNLHPQIKKRVKENHPVEGLTSLLRAYQKLRTAEATNEIPKFEEWLKLEPKEIEELVAEIQARARLLRSNQ